MTNSLHRLFVVLSFFLFLISCQEKDNTPNETSGGWIKYDHNPVLGGDLPSGCVILKTGPEDIAAVKDKRHATVVQQRGFGNDPHRFYRESEM